MNVCATPVGQAVTATMRVPALATSAGASAAASSSWALAAASSRKPSRSARAWDGVLWYKRLPTKRARSTGPVLITSTQSASAICTVLSCRSGCPASCTSTLVLQPRRWAAADSKRALSTLDTWPLGQAVTMAMFIGNPLVVLSVALRLPVAPAAHGHGCRSQPG
ncbi:hypothetical protein D3C80_979300 [compost metagenome]